MTNKLMPSLTDNEYLAIDQFIRRSYAGYGEYIQAVVLFGSKAKGDFMPDSDIDLVIRTTKEDFELCWAIRQIASRVSLEHDLLLSIRVIGPEQWHKLAEHCFTFYENVQTDGIDLTPVLD